MPDATLISCASMQAANARISTGQNASGDAERALPQVANEANRQRNTGSVPLNIKSKNALLIVNGAIPICFVYCGDWF